jgi:DNA replication initiation complex subunit (GINS family)
MSEVVITYEKLFEILRLEKQREELQPLDKQFYAHVLHYINQKKEVFDQAVDESNIFVGGEREKNRILLENIKRILKELYDRREKKIIDMAINESRTGAKLANTENMLDSEKELYESITTQLALKRKEVLWRLLNGMLPIGTQELSEEQKQRSETRKNTEDEELLEETTTSSQESNTTSQEPEINEKTTPFKPQDLKTDAILDEEGLRIQLLEEVDQIVGPDLQIYGPFEKNTVTAVPKELANALIKTGKAKRAES